MSRNPLAPPVVSLDRLRADIGAAVGDPGALDAASGDLIACGLDSVKVMVLASRWRAAGIEVRFADLMDRPTLDGWWELLRGQTAAAPTPVDAAAAADDLEPFDLATMQHAYWVGRDESIVLGGVATHFYAEFDGAVIDRARLDTAVRALLERHAMLRAQILDDGRQRVLPRSPWSGTTVHDFRALDKESVTAGLAAVRERLSHRRFDIGAGEVMDIALSLLPDGTARLHLNLDMLVADALSFRIILHDLACLYADPDEPLPPIDYSFRRYLADRRSRPDPARAAAERYWQERVAGLPGPPALPRSTDARLTKDRRVTRRFHRLTPDERGVLAVAAARHGVTLSMMFAAAFAETVAAWSAEPDFVLNVPLFDRELLHPDVAHLVGDFTNLLIVAVQTGGPSFADTARAVQARLTADTANSAVSGLEVLRELGRQRGGQAIAPVVFTSAIGLGELFTSQVRSCFGDAGWNISQAPQVWLDHQVTEDAGGLLLNWDAIEELFPDGVLDAMFAGYRSLLDWLAEPGSDWHRPVPCLVPAEAVARRAEVNATEGPQRRTVLQEGFLAAVDSDPDRPALVAHGREIGYGELAARARRVAGMLCAAGLERGDVVAVTLPKGAGQFEAVLGILFAGGVFLPVGVEVPAARRAAVHRVARARFVLADSDIDAGDDVPVFVLSDSERAEPAEPVPADADDLAYVIYTSGSTGEPKCVEMTHRAAMNTVEDIGDRFGVTGESRGFALSALDHDWSVYDIFAFLSVGGSLVLVEPEHRKDAHRWLELVLAHRVNVWTSVPALLDMLLVTAEARQVRLPLRLAMVGGDWVGLDLHDRLLALAPGCRFVALGGATEVGIHSTWHEVAGIPAGWRSIPYGAPLRNQLTRVVDAADRDRPDLVPGELLLGGVGVGPGYRGDPGLTARRFPEWDGTRWYRTGDMARFHPDGTLEFLGRVDAQVKILGHRVELGDVAAALTALPGVTRAVAVLTRDSPPALVAAVTVDTVTVRTDTVETVTWDAEAVRVELSTRLPEHMVPRRIARVDTLPLTANGKIDRRAVAELLTGSDGAAPTAPPEGPVEERVAALWQDLLRKENVGRDDDFFALGGNSLLATRLVTALRGVGFPDVRLSDLFTRPTLRSLAEGLVAREVDDETTSAASSGLMARPGERYEPFPATDVQRAYWLGRSPEFTLGGVGSHWYWEFTGAPVDVDRLTRAWDAVVRRHDMLRAIFDDNGDQRVLAEVPGFVIETTHGGAEAVARMREAMAHRVFAPDQWPLFDLRVVTAADGTATVGIGLDFLTLDAMSIMLVVGELAERYANPDLVLPGIGVSFRDCVLAGAPDTDRVERARRYWLDRVPTLPLGPRLPLARQPEELTTPRFTRREGRLSATAWQAISERAAARGVTPSTVVATAFAAVIANWSADPSFTLNFTLFDRPDLHPDIYRVVGDFTSLLLVAHEPEAGEPFARAARRMQERVWSDMEHSAYSGVSVLRDLAAHHERMDVPVPVVFTSTIGMAAVSDRPFSLRTPFGEYSGGLSQTPQVWLDHQVTEHDGGLLLNWDAVEDLFPDDVLDTMFAAYRRVLDHIAAPDADWSEPLVIPLPAEQARIRAQVNDTGDPVPQRLLHTGFLDRAAAEPDRVALAWSGGSLTYGALRERADRIAGSLRAAGVTGGDRVAVNLARGADQIAAVLGVLHAGGVYVPIGVDQPAQRRDRMLITAGARAVITASTDPLPGGIALVRPSDTAEPFGPPAPTDPRDPAYIIFTSGSTGEPKGVEVDHAAAWNTVADINDRFGVGPDDRVLAVSSLGFDLSVYDVFGLLAVGGAVVLVDEDHRADAPAWRALIAEHGVTVWNSAPALLDMLTATDAGPAPTGLRLALVSGDWVGLDLPGRVAAHTGGCVLVAMGGATEAAIWSNFHVVDEVPAHWTSIPYGTPLRAQRFRVVADGRDRPDRVPGELWIGGAGVARGYHGDPETTASRFVTTADGRWYRTGDLGRYWPDGTLEFLGRVDQQVKVRGHRIELGEVEAALRGHPGVDRAVALVVGEPVRRLAAAVVPDASGLDTEALRAHLAERLPDYMVPATVLVLDEIPLTRNGKVDRAALATAATGTRATGSAAPEGALQLAIAELWTDLLGCGALGRDESFFALGGDSLLATRLVERARRTFGVRLTLRDLMAAPTVAAQARLVAARAAATGSDPAGETYEEGEL